MGSVEHALGKKLCGEVGKLIVVFAQCDDSPTTSDVERWDAQDAADESDRQREDEQQAADYAASMEPPVCEPEVGYCVCGTCHRYRST